MPVKQVVGPEVAIQVIAFDADFRIDQDPVIEKNGFPSMTGVNAMRSGMSRSRSRPGAISISAIPLTVSRKTALSLM